MPPPRPFRRRALLVLAALIVLLAAADAVAWHVFVTRLEEGFALWQAQCRAAGWTVAAAPWRRGGWPLAARLDIPTLAISGGRADLPGGAAWHGEVVGIAMSALRPTTLVVTIGGAQEFGWPTCRR